jgi:hypothetical protein
MVNQDAELAEFSSDLGHRDGDSIDRHGVAPAAAHS